MDTTSAETVDILEQVKKIDKAVKAKLLIEKIAILKKYAREVNELREKSLATLEEMGISGKDSKRIIDYINELPEVKLSERHREDIRNEIVDEISEEKTKTEKTLRNVDIEKLLGNYTGGATSTPTWTTGTPMYGTYTTTCGSVAGQSGLGDTVYLSNAVGSSVLATLDNGNGDTLQFKL